MNAGPASVAHQFAVNVLAQGLARVLSIGANLALMVVVARTMGTAFFGQLNYVLAFSTIAIALADLGTTAVLARGLVQHGEARAAYLGNFLLMRLVLTVVVMVGAGVVAFVLPGNVLPALLIVVAGLPVLATRFFEPIYQVYGKPWLSPWSNMVFGAAQLLLALAIWLVPTLSVAQICTGIVIANLAYTAVAAWMMLSVVKPDMRPHRELMGHILRLGAPQGVGSIFTTIILRADVIILAHLLGDTVAGLYSAAYRLLELAVFVAITVITPLIPILTDQIKRDRRAALVHCRMAAQLAGLLSLPVAIVVPTVAPPIITAVLGADFAAASAPLDVLVLNFVLIAFSLLVWCVNLANGEVAHGYWNAPLACVVNLSLNFLLIPQLGMVGAAWATVASQLVMFLVSNFYVATRFGNLYEPRTWARLAFACGVLWACLQVTEGMGPFVSAGLSLAVFAALAAWLQLFPRQIIEFVLVGRRLRSST